MPAVRSVTIIGGGVIGCFLAYRLALEGVPVTVIERHAVGAGATGASAGNVQPGVMGGIVDAQGVLGTLGAQSLQLHRAFLPAIKESSGLDPLDHGRRGGRSWRLSQSARHLDEDHHGDERARGHATMNDHVRTP